MKIGDLVKKINGSHDIGLVGIILEDRGIHGFSTISSNEEDREFNVLTNEGIRRWKWWTIKKLR